MTINVDDALESLGKTAFGIRDQRDALVKIVKRYLATIQGGGIKRHTVVASQRFVDDLANIDADARKLLVEIEQHKQP